ncbi:hypothetical protein SAMN05421505_13035 [Sinosporangium album]|uniref:Uncharacterized protein n=1 Tax=Sinosporangium album TaxID=504805 RepID=A0A1G8H2M0_9ACTN|nr:hypothetical protein [Sinosporangium album]SDI00874.1 hypothetical protein SAMN05421505_13035 [Sinosporangium album]
MRIYGHGHGAVGSTTKVIGVGEGAGGAASVGSWGPELPFTGFPVMFGIALSVTLILSGRLIIRMVRLRRSS